MVPSPSRSAISKSFSSARQPNGESLVTVDGAVAVEVRHFKKLLQRQAAERRVARVNEGLDDFGVRADHAAAEAQEPLLAHDSFREPHDRREDAIFRPAHKYRRVDRRRAAAGRGDAEIWSRHEG